MTAPGKPIRLIQPRICYGIKPRNSEQTFALNAMLNPEISLVTVSGKAGTGKTLLALAAGPGQKAVLPPDFYCPSGGTLE